MSQLNNLFFISSYQGLLKLTDSTQGLTNTLQKVQTGDGQNSPLQISQTDIKISGSLYQEGLFYADGITFNQSPSIQQKTGSYVMTYDETKHLKKIEIKEVKGFGDDDDFTTPSKSSSDFSLD